jgi:Mrp family chromosome partitioning ATPase
VIFIDAPPLAPVIDASIVAKLADKVLFVVQWRKTPRQVVERALAGIENSRQKVAGIILNNTQLHLAASYAPYYGYYNKQYQKYYQQ